MRKLVLILLLFLFHQTLFSQEIKDKITIEFNAASRKAVLQKIENTTSYHFFYNEDWLNDNSLISGNYQDIDIKALLEVIFNKTNLNFFIDKNKIILTNNSVIYDKLPEGFFDNYNSNVTKQQEAVLENPIFHQQYDSISTSSSKKTNAIVFIGKQTKNNEKKSFVLTGYIKKKNGEAASNIVLRVRNKKTNTTTDKDGFYSLTLTSGLNIIEAESLNFTAFSKRIIIYSDGQLDLTVSENLNLLSEVIVKSRKSQKARTAVSGVTTLNAEGIKTIPLVLGERDLLRVATTLPGVKTTGEGSAGFNVRGGKEDQNLILLDNAVLYNPAHFFGFFSALNPYTTSKVDIYKGSIPAEFGGRLSSVFDISSKDGNYDKFAGEGGIGPVTSNISLSTPIVKGKSSLIFGGRATYSGWVLKSLKEETLRNSEASFYDGILKYNHQINTKNTLETMVYYSHDSYSVSSDSLYKYSNRLVSLKWNHTFNDKNKGALIFTNSEYKFNIDYQPEDPLNAFDFGYKINESQVMFKMNYAFNKKHKFNYGLLGKRYSIQPGYLNPKNTASELVPISIEKEKGFESALYVSDNFKVNDKLLLDVGLRYSFYAALGASKETIYQANAPINDATVVDVKEYGNNEVIKTYGGFEPRLAARYFITEDFSVKAGYDKTYQYIHLLSNNTTQSPTDTWKLSDLNVKPQSAHQFSIGFYKDLKDGMYELSIESYYKKSKNILDYKVGAQLLLNENIETQLLQGEGKSYGIEFLIKKEIGRLNGWLGYTYSRTFIKLDSKFNEEKVNNGNYFAANFDKPHDFSAVLNFKITKRYSISSNFIYQTGRPITYPIGTYTYENAEYTLYSDRNKFRIPDYYRLDIGINIEGNHKIKKLAHSFWNISVYNVLGRNNPYSIFFVTKEGEIKAYKTSIFAIPVPTITYNFKF